MKAIVIFGPTATGKTDLALRLAKKLNGEIISADSRQVYKKLDIGTGKLSENLTKDHGIKKLKAYWIVDGIKIHGFDLANPGDKFSVANFTKFAKAKMQTINKSKKLPIIAGGSGFYIKSLLDTPETFKIAPNTKLRLSLENNSVDELYKMLNKLDTFKANSLNNSDKNNPRRLIRAIEVASSKYKKEKNKPIADYLILGLTANNKFLFAKVDDWLDFRLKNGLIDEVNHLLLETDSKWLIALGLEYRWITRYLETEVSKEIAIDRLKGDIHKLVRIQKNWFHQFPNIKLFDITKANWQNKFEKTVTVWYTQDK